MEQLAEFAPMVQILDDPVPLMVEQLVDVLQLFDALVPVAEQVIDVPKIILEDIPTRIIRKPQLAEQLVDVPTEPAFGEQTVDIPVPRGRGRHLQGFLPEQSSTASVVEQIVHIPVPGGGLPGSRPRQVQQLHPHFLALQLCSTMRMRRLKGVFALFFE